MLNITDNAQEQKIPAFFRLGFRSMFLSAAIFSVIAILIWLLALHGSVEFSPFNNILWWHGHEMLFGFVSAIIVGFLLTAVQTWTGQPGLKGWALFSLWGLWLSARLLLAIKPAIIPPIVIILIDLSFLPLAGYFLAKPILRVKQYKNMVFAPVLLLLSICNGLTYIEPTSGLSDFFRHGTYAAVMFISLIMTIMGGRVIPFFTASGTKTVKRENIQWIEWLSVISVGLLAFSFLFNLAASKDYSIILSVLFFIAALTNFIRFSRWRFFSTINIPLLWSLQLSYLFIPLTFLLLALHYAFGIFSLSSILHGLTIGAMGNMVLAMMARVSLGHTGRPLKVNKLVVSAFVALLIAASLRVVAGMWINDSYLLLTSMSAGFWVYGFTVFSVIYFPILTQPRVDGRPG